MWSNNRTNVPSPSAAATQPIEPPLAIDTRTEIPVTYPVLNRGSRSPQRNTNPWNSILAPRASPKAKTKTISTAQSPTTTAAARRIRKQKVLERARIEEEEAMKKGGVAYARMKREKAKEEARNATGINRVKVRSGKKSKNATTTGATKDQGSTRGSSNTGKNSSTSNNTSSNAKRRNGTATSSAPRTSNRASTQTTIANPAPRATRSTKTTRTTRTTRTTTSSTRHRTPSKIPTPQKMKQLEQDAESQESIRALIDKVTIEFERLPSSIPTEQRSDVNQDMHSVLNTVSRTLQEGRTAPSIRGSGQGDGLVNQSMDLESVRNDIEINHQEVDREEMELKRRSNALENDMKKLKEKKLKLHLAKYEVELRSTAKTNLHRLMVSSKKEVLGNIQLLKEKTTVQLQAMSDFEEDLAGKIKRLMKLQEQAIEKRKLLEETCLNGEKELMLSYETNLHRKKEEHEANIQQMLNKAAKDEGFVIG